MKNKNILLLFTVFLLPLTTQSMKRNNTELISSEKHISHNSWIKELQEKRNTFKKKLLLKSNKSNPFWWVNSSQSEKSKNFVLCTYQQILHKKVMPSLFLDIDNINSENEIFFGSYNINKLDQLHSYHLEPLQKGRVHNYSALGSATMAEKVTFQEKREFIQKLLDLDFVPTPEDKELALVATYEEFGPTIIEKKLLLQHAPSLSKIYVPQDIINYIALLIFKNELLF